LSKNQRCNDLEESTLAFFQLEMHGGIFHSCCSLTVTLRLGECITGAGGDGGPFGIFLFVLQKAQQPHLIKLSITHNSTRHLLYTSTSRWLTVPA